MGETSTVEGMSCGHCEATVEDALADVEGVTGAEAEHESGTVVVEGEADTDALLSAITDAGFEAAG